MRFARRERRRMPLLNTSSLPDLIFTVLFFFMIVTHMRKVPLKVEYQVPQGTELTRLTKKTAVSYIYIGRPMQPLRAKEGGGTRIQLNDKFAGTEDIIDYISAERKRMSPTDLEQMVVSIKADKNTRMGVITDVKQALRQAHAQKINYSSRERDF